MYPRAHTILATLVVELRGLENVSKLVEHAASRVRRGVDAIWARNALEVGSRGQGSESEETDREFENHCVCL